MDFVVIRKEIVIYTYSSYPTCFSTFYYVFFNFSAIKKLKIATKFYNYTLKKVLCESKYFENIEISKLNKNTICD